MFDLKFIRENIDRIQAGLDLRNDDTDLNKFQKLESERRKVLAETEELKALRNRVSQEIAQLKREKGDADSKITEMREVGERIKGLDEKVRAVEADLYEIQIRIPNIPHPDVPKGNSDEENLEVKTWGQPKEHGFTPKPHWEIAEKLQLVDFERGAKVAGSSFVAYTGRGAKLARALINYMLETHTEKHGYTEVSPPFMVNRASMFGTGSLPKFGDDMYHAAEDDLYMIPTAEVPVTNLFAGEMLQEEQLPIYYAAYSPCFRREAGAHGKETRGLMRLHQFDKVEMVKFVTAESSYEEHEKLLADAEAILQALDLHYRVVTLCSGDLGFSAAKCYDLEAWAPAAGNYLEVSSCSNFEAFQARRANIRYRPKAGGKPEFVHTLNGSGLALPRILIAIMENYQTEEGNLIVPEVLRPFMGMEVIE